MTAGRERIPPKRRRPSPSRVALLREYLLAGRRFAELFSVAGRMRPGKPITFRRETGRYRVDVGDDHGPWAESLAGAIGGWIAPGRDGEGRAVAARRRNA